MEETSIDQTMEMLVELYRDILEQNLVEWSVVRKGLTIVLDDLTVAEPCHPIVERLRAFISTNDLRSRH